MNDSEREKYAYRAKYVEIFIDGGEYVEYDRKLERETERRPATPEEIASFSNEERYTEDDLASLDQFERSAEAQMNMVMSGMHDSGGVPGPGEDSRDFEEDLNRPVARRGLPTIDELNVERDSNYSITGSVYRADVYCCTCTDAIRDDLFLAKKCPVNLDDETTYDSDEFPKFIVGHNDPSDSPQHCGNGRECLEPLVLGRNTYGAFLDQPLTADGEQYVREQHRDRPSDLTRFWMRHYDLKVLRGPRLHQGV